MYLFPQNNLELMLLSFIGCHLLGMSSASINPVLYGFLNESFKKEFLDIFDTVTLRKIGVTAAAAATGEFEVVTVWSAARSADRADGGSSSFLGKTGVNCGRTVHLSFAQREVSKEFLVILNA